MVKVKQNNNRVKHKSTLLIIISFQSYNIKIIQAFKKTKFPFNKIKGLTR